MKAYLQLLGHGAMFLHISNTVVMIKRNCLPTVYRIETEGQLVKAAEHLVQACTEIIACLEQRNLGIFSQPLC